MRYGLLAIALALVSVSLAEAAEIDVTKLKSFGTSGKREFILGGGKEAELFSYEGRGCLTHMWFGGDWPGYDRTRLRVYVDGEEAASIDMEMFLGHGIGFGDDAAPWGTERMGKTGQPSGIFNNYRIPFGKSVRVTAQLGKGVEEDPPFWWIIRGVENLPVVIGDLRLPDDARLRLHTFEKQDLDALEMVDLVTSDKAGILYQVTLSVRSENMAFLEAVLRAWIDGAEEPLLLSSGTEDYYLGTYYFNRGPYHLPEAGVTHLDSWRHEFSGYRFHAEDPVVFQDSLRLAWRNGEARENGEPYGKPRPSELYSYVWVYEWVER
jgi:hypothetical protein